jgi:glycosyltransferase involved in cell wall biosynthesis
MLHIVIDVRHIRDFGIGTYIRNLTRALARLDQTNRYTLVTRPGEEGDAAGLGGNFSTAPYGRSEMDLAHNITFPHFLRQFQANLYHIPLNLIPWWMPAPYVVTIHDMSSLLFPAYRRDVRRTIKEEQYRRGALRAARIIAVSNSTRRDIESVLHVPPQLIRTIYSAPDPAFVEAAQNGDMDRQILDRYSIHDPFVLYAGAIRPQKNIPRLIQAFGVVRQEFENHPYYRDLRLIIIGDELSKYPSVRRAVVEARMENVVRFLGFVPLETLRVFYRAAAAFAFPSLYEGFGLAPLEAMACGTPVVASDVPPLVEAVGDAAELVSPDNVFDIARGLRQVLADPDRRAALSTAGRERAARYHWDDTARQVLSVYEEILKK